MRNGLQRYFPMIRTRAEVLKDIESQPKLSQIFQNWEQEQQEAFLDYITGVKGVKILPTDNSRIADESSLLIMDILIELEDGSLANIEVQKTGYKFPGQRCACYSADLLLRQYKRVRGEKKDLFSYKDMKRV